MDDEKPIYVGCEVLVVANGRLLLGKRKNCYGAGTWALPGGHLEFNEPLVTAACREIKEELGATVQPGKLRLVSIVDALPANDSDRHYVHVSFELTESDFEPKLMEPERCEEWRYFPLDKLPLDNFFWPHRDIINNYLQKRLYSL